MKKISIFATVALAVAMIVSCSDDDSSENAFENLRAEFVEAHTDKNSAMDYVITDDGETLLMDKLYGLNIMNRPDTLYRALLFYLPLTPGTITPVQIALIPTIEPRELAADEEMKADPVTYESAWVSKTKKYLNMAFYIQVSASGTDAKKHVIGFVKESVDTLADGKTITNVHFFHDRKGTPEYYSAKYYVSVPCSSFDTDSVRVKVQTYDKLIVEKFGVKR